MRRTLLWLSTVVGLSACATLGGEDGGSDNLPTRGIAGWVKTSSTDAPYLFTSTAELAFSEPSAFALNERLYLFLTEQSADQVRILLAESADGQSFGSPREVLSGYSAAQAIADTQGQVWLIALDSDKAPALFKASTISAPFSEVTANGFLNEAYASPSLTLEGDTLSLYWLRAGQLVVQQSKLGALHFDAPREVLAAGTDCVNLENKPTSCWDKDNLNDAEVRLATTALGRTLLRTFYVGNNTELGFAAANQSGDTFTRYADNPVFENKPRLGSTTSVRFKDRYHLYYHANQSTGRPLGIAHAISPEGLAPTETF